MEIVIIMSIVALSLILTILAVYIIKRIIKILRKIQEKFTYWDEQNEWLKSEFKRCNVIVFGKKGSGKDVLFSHVINLLNEPHYSNMVYNELTIVKSLEYLSAGENTFKNFINNNIKKFEPQFEENLNYYISDGGVYLPSQYDKELNIKYPSMPIFYALSRQLHEMCIHANVQYIGRLWVKLREQADSYIWVRKCNILSDCIIVHTITYNRYESANKQLLPVKDVQFNAVNGEIVERKFKIMLKDIKFNTRYFREILLLYEEQKEPLEKIRELYKYGYSNMQ